MRVFNYRSLKVAECLSLFYLQTIEELQELLKAKFDVASQNMLLNASKYADSETMNLQKVVGDAATTLCMWGNLSKNPRCVSLFAGFCVLIQHHLYLCI